MWWLVQLKWLMRMAGGTAQLVGFMLIAFGLACIGYLVVHAVLGALFG